jgi:hypothetical protein
VGGSSARNRPSSARYRLNRLHLAVKVLGIAALVAALFKDSGHAAIYVPGIVALASSHKLLGASQGKAKTEDEEQ